MQPIIRAGDATLSSGPPAAGDGQRAQAPTPQQSGLRRCGSRTVGRRPRPAYRRESRAERRALVPLARPSLRRPLAVQRARPEVGPRPGRKYCPVSAARQGERHPRCWTSRSGFASYSRPAAISRSRLPFEAHSSRSRCALVLGLERARRIRRARLLWSVRAFTGGRGSDRRLLRCGGTARRRRC